MTTNIENVYGKTPEQLVAEGKARWARQKAAALAKAKAEGKEPWQLVNFHPTEEETEAFHPEAEADRPDVKDSDTSSS